MGRLDEAAFYSEAIRSDLRDDWNKNDVNADPIAKLFNLFFRAARNPCLRVRIHHDLIGTRPNSRGGDQADDCR